MIVKAVNTNCCKQLKDIDSCYGVLHKPDLFDIESSFKTVDVEKSDVHYCIQCYTLRVVNVADQLIKRKGNEDKYRAKIKELTYLFKRSLFNVQQLAAITGK